MVHSPEDDFCGLCQAIVCRDELTAEHTQQYCIHWMLQYWLRLCKDNDWDTVSLTCALNFNMVHSPQHHFCGLCEAIVSRDELTVEHTQQYCIHWMLQYWLRLCKDNDWDTVSLTCALNFNMVHSPQHHFCGLCEAIVCRDELTASPN